MNNVYKVLVVTLFITQEWLKICEEAQPGRTSSSKIGIFNLFKQQINQLLLYKFCELWLKYVCKFYIKIRWPDVSALVINQRPQILKISIENKITNFPANIPQVSKLLDVFRCACSRNLLVLWHYLKLCLRRDSELKVNQHISTNVYPICNFLYFLLLEGLHEEPDNLNYVLLLLYNVEQNMTSLGQYSFNRRSGLIGLIKEQRLEISGF
ncbi:hypothetical protein AGLY_011298 [Aphis glycines]|uniref:Uncharacterized protein n=1 Tax=Aphis glycines TaxID=307491 RepID=A0A6G0TD18_APHGL|nr:hypothetical protein AGLY_011298 [Aphis glycines]